MTIREEQDGDGSAVYAVIEQAFERPEEARLVDRLRCEAEPYLGLVAVQDGKVVGYVAFSPVTVDGWANHPRAAGLAPLAVATAVQRQGIGGQLVRAGLDQCRALGFELVVVLGDPEYYARFGFVPAAEHHLGSVYDAPAGAFRVLALTPTALQGATGTVQYHEAFTDA